MTVSDLDTMEIEVLGAPIGAGIVQTPGDAPGKGGLIFRVFFEVCGDKHAVLCRREALPHCTHCQGRLQNHGETSNSEGHTTPPMTPRTFPHCHFRAESLGQRHEEKDFYCWLQLRGSTPPGGAGGAGGGGHRLATGWPPQDGRPRPGLAAARTAPPA